MTLLIILVMNAAILALIALVINRRSQTLSLETTSAKNAKQAAEQKFAQAKSELTLLKEENLKKTKQLEELREISKRRLKKDSQKDNSEEVLAMTENLISSTSPNFDLALKTVQQQADQAHQEELATLKSHYEERVLKLESQLGQRKQTVEKNKKNLSANLIANVEGLPEEAILEMGRLIKRSEHAEKLFAATRGKLQMSQERFSEMQKRYFGVCRELALATGQNLGISDEEIRNQAEDLLAVSDRGIQA